MIPIVKRLSVLVIFVGACFFIAKFHCIQVFFSSTPRLITDYSGASSVDKIFVISSDSVCNICPAGSYIFSTRDENALYILPKESSDAEIENFVFTYEVAGTVIVSDDAFEEYLNLYRKCSGLERNKNYVFHVSDGAKKIQMIKIF